MMFSKQEFMTFIKPMAREPQRARHEVMRFGKHYELWFGISGKHEKNIEISCQLINCHTNQTFRDKYICPDLYIDCVKQGITSDYKLFKYLENHYSKAIAEYEEKFPEWRTR